MARRVGQARRAAAAGAGLGGRQVDGLYAALLAIEQEHHARPDPREMRRLHPEGGYCTTPGAVCAHEPIPLPRSPLLDALEAGRPVVLEGRNLRGHRLPEVTLRREQAFDRFEVRPDDTVRPAAAED